MTSLGKRLISSAKPARKIARGELRIRVGKATDAERWEMMLAAYRQQDIALTRLGEAAKAASAAILRWGDSYQAFLASELKERRRNHP